MLLNLVVPMQLWAAPCQKSIQALHDFPTPDHKPEAQLEFESLVKEIEAVTYISHSSCAESPETCAKYAIEESLDEKRITNRFKRFFSGKKEKACAIKKVRTARQNLIAKSNLVLNLGAGAGATYWFHQIEKKAAAADGKPAPNFNYAFLAAMVGMIIYRSVVQCQNEIDTDSMVDLTARQKAWKKFWRYTKMNAIANSMFISLLAVQDLIEGENPLDPEHLKSYAVDFAFGMVWDGAWAMSHIKFFDRALLHPTHGLPAVRRQISLWLRKGILRPVIARINGRNTLVFMRGLSDVPGFSIEALARFGLTSGRTASYLGIRSELLNYIFVTPQVVTQEVLPPALDDDDPPPLVEVLQSQ